MPNARMHEMLINPNLEVELFNMWSIDLMGPFVISYENKCILVDVYHISKWVETIASPNNESKSIIFFLKKNILTWFGTSEVVILDRGSYLFNRVFGEFLKKYGVKHKMVTLYLLQLSGQVLV